MTKPLKTWQLNRLASGYQIVNDAQSYPCLIGADGLIQHSAKREGDNKTPCGTWLLSAVFFRADRIAPPKTDLPCYPISPSMGWCDDAASIDYNSLVVLPHAARCEELYREDSSYDIVVTTSHNQNPVVTALGSAIFVHCIAKGKTNTAGCVALQRDSLLALLRSANTTTCLVI